MKLFNKESPASGNRYLDLRDTTELLGQPGAIAINVLGSPASETRG